VINRDILLILIGGAVGGASSLLTLLFVYMIEGMRLRRKWQREDVLLLRKKRAEIEEMLTRVAQGKDKATTDVESEI
jgi:hypothetical protein